MVTHVFCVHEAGKRQKALRGRCLHKEQKPAQKVKTSPIYVLHVCTYVHEGQFSQIRIIMSTSTYIMHVTHSSAMP